MGIMVKKFTYFMFGIFLFLLSGSSFSGALEFHNAIADQIQRFDSFPESGWLIVLGLAADFRSHRSAPSPCRSPHPLGLSKDSATVPANKAPARRAFVLLPIFHF
jgi:hypothetical protein